MCFDWLNISRIYIVYFYEGEVCGGWCCHVKLGRGSSGHLDQLLTSLVPRPLNPLEKLYKRLGSHTIKEKEGAWAYGL